MLNDKAFQWWNPLSWFAVLIHVVSTLFRSIFELFGLLSRPPTDRHEHIQMADVNDAAKDARDAHAAVDKIVAALTPAQVVHAYCTATEDARTTMDLSKLSVEQQDWLMRLSDADLVMLGGSGEAACGRSVEARRLMVSRSKLRLPGVETASQVLATPEPMTDEQKREFLLEFMKDRHSELFLALGVANPNPKFTPRETRPTVH